MLYATEFSVENNLLTPTFKLKRNVCAKEFKSQIDDMYKKIEAAEAARAASTRQ